MALPKIMTPGPFARMLPGQHRAFRTAGIRTQRHSDPHGVRPSLRFTPAHGKGHAEGFDPDRI